MKRRQSRTVFLWGAEHCRLYESERETFVYHFIQYCYIQISVIRKACDQDLDSPSGVQSYCFLKHFKYPFCITEILDLLSWWFVLPQEIEQVES